MSFYFIYKYYFILFISFLCLQNIHSLSKQDLEEAIFLEKFFKPGDLVFDIGANIGTKTDIYLYNGAQVVCVEPQPTCISILKKKYNNNQSVLTIIPKGLANKNGLLEFSVSSHSRVSTFSREWQNIYSHYSDKGYTWKHTLLIETTTLDALIKEFGCPQFCKIDVENFEYEVLIGLSHKIPYISFEYSATLPENIKKCIDHLEYLGYTLFNFTLKEKSTFILDQWISATAIKKHLLNKIKNTDKNIIWDFWGDIYAQ